MLAWGIAAVVLANIVSRSDEIRDELWMLSEHQAMGVILIVSAFLTIPVAVLWHALALTAKFTFWKTYPL